MTSTSPRWLFELPVSGSCHCLSSSDVTSTGSVRDIGLTGVFSDRGAAVDQMADVVVQQRSPGSVRVIPAQHRNGNVARRILARQAVPYRLEGTIGVDAGRLGQPVFGPMTLIRGETAVR